MKSANCAFAGAVATTLAVASTSAQTIPDAVKLHGDVRLRFEHARSDAFENDSNALTLRGKLSVEAPLGRRAWVLVEGEGNARIAGVYDDLVGPRLDRPAIADPDGVELNRFVLGARLGNRSQIRIGRQKLSLDDERFLGAVAFRQNDQTYDAVSLATAPSEDFSFEAGYIRRANRILGRRNPAGVFRGDSYYLNASAVTPVGRITAFHYAFDLDDRTASPDALINSSASTGVRLNGSRRRDEFGVNWEASYAVQRDFADNPIDYEAQYFLIGAGVEIDRFAITLRREELGAGDGRAFQTPLGTLHAFQGAADLFLTTPADGIVDHSVTAAYSFGDFGAVRGVNVFVRRHWFDAERIDQDYGREWNLGVRAKIAGLQASLVYAGYAADQFAADEERLWVTASKKF
ncbi:MAG: alginate export family protein [Pseudomonadota bacterium]